MAHTENRNLVVCETFDDFAERVEKVDFDVEDIVGLVTSLANVFYWLNVESVWGPLGFTWTKTDDYGVFNKTTIPFTVIPKLPDGERIKQLNNTFNNIVADSIEVRKSNWENLYSLNNPWQNKFVKADLTGAKITYVNNLLYHSKTVENDTDIKGLYLKADFSGVSYLYNNTGTIYNPDRRYRQGAYLQIDDDNKGLFNAPASDKCCLWWSGEGEFKLEYFYREEGLQNQYNEVYVYSENGKLNLTNIGNSNIRIMSNRFDTEADRNASTDIYPTAEETPIDLTIDGRNNPVIQIRKWFDARIEDAPAKFFFTSPIKLVNYDSIDWINPWYLLRDEWPELPDEELEKWEDSENSSFMPYLMIDNLELAMNCPYTIDASKRKYLNIFNCGVWNNSGGLTYGYTADDMIAAGAESVTVGSRTYAIADILPNITGFDHTFEQISLPNYTVGGAFWRLPNCTIRAKKFCPQGGYYIDEHTVIECSYKPGWENYCGVILHDASTIHWRLFPDDSGKIDVGSFTRGNGLSLLNTSDDINFVEFETHDETVLKASNIDTFRYRPGSNFKQDIVICNSNNSNIDASESITIESAFIFIYASNLSLLTKDESVCSYETLKKLIDGLVKDESGTAHSVTLKSWIYNQLTDDEKSHIINDLGYTLVEQK